MIPSMIDYHVSLLVFRYLVTSICQHMVQANRYTVSQPRLYMNNPTPFMQPRIINMKHVVHSLEFGDSQLVRRRVCVSYSAVHQVFVLHSQSSPFFLVHLILSKKLITPQIQVHGSSKSVSVLKITIRSWSVIYLKLALYCRLSMASSLEMYSKICPTKLDLVSHIPENDL